MERSLISFSTTGLSVNFFEPSKRFGIYDDYSFSSVIQLESNLYTSDRSILPILITYSYSEYQQTTWHRRVITTTPARPTLLQRAPLRTAVTVMRRQRRTLSPLTLINVCSFLSFSLNLDRASLTMADIHRVLL